MSLCSGGNRGDARLGRWSLSHMLGPTHKYTGMVTSTAEGKRVNTSNTRGPDLDHPPQLGRTPATPMQGLHRGRIRRRPVTVTSVQPSPHPGATTTTGCDPSPRRSVLHAFRSCVFILFSFRLSPFSPGSFQISCAACLPPPPPSNRLALLHHGHTTRAF
jgi:hypothetical protein